MDFHHESHEIHYSGEGEEGKEGAEVVYGDEHSDEKDHE